MGPMKNAAFYCRRLTNFNNSVAYALVFGHISVVAWWLIVKIWGYVFTVSVCVCDRETKEDLLNFVSLILELWISLPSIMELNV